MNYPHKVTLQRANGRNARGQPAYRPYTTERARVDQLTSFFPGVGGERVTSRYTVHLLCQVTIGDLVGVNGVSYPVLTVDASQDITGKTNGYKVRL